MVTKLKDIFRTLLIVASAVMVAGVVIHLFVGSQLSGTSKVPDQADVVATKPPTKQTADAALATCEPFPVSTEGKVAVLRIDDVQAYAWGETTRKMIDDAFAQNIPLTLGVIPKSFSDDVLLGQYLVARSCNLEFALHGWDHQVQQDGVTPEFVDLDEETAKARLRWGINELRAAGIENVETWIPPQNAHSQGTEVAATSLGLIRQSTEGDGRWDYDATSYVYGGDQLLLEPEVVVANCEAQIEEDSKCIIMLHPQNYADGLEHDSQVYEDYYLALIDQLTNAGYSFARFTDLDTVE